MYIAPRPVQKEFVKESYKSVPKKAGAIIFIALLMMSFVQYKLIYEIENFFEPYLVALPPNFQTLKMMTPIVQLFVLGCALYLLFFKKADLSHLDKFLSKYKPKEMIPGKELPRPHTEEAIILGCTFLLALLTAGLMLQLRSIDTVAIQLQ